MMYDSLMALPSSMPTMTCRVWLVVLLPHSGIAVVIRVSMFQLLFEGPITTTMLLIARLVDWVHHKCW
jgi:hypothetical protein